jgi:hypothetical protein
MRTFNSAGFPIVESAGVKFDFAAAILARTRDVARSRQRCSYFVSRHKPIPGYAPEPCRFYHVPEIRATPLHSLDLDSF